MIYRTYIYGSTAATGTAPAIGCVNSAICTESETEWKDNDAAEFMESFDHTKIKAQIESEIGDRCKVIVKYPPKKFEQKGYLYIATSYEQISSVLPRLHAISAENGLALYDTETDKTFYKDLLDTSMIEMKLRIQALKDAILSSVAPVWRIRKLHTHYGKRDKESSFVVILSKKPGESFLERTQAFYQCLKSNLKDDEKLVCDGKCFTVKKEWYSITFALEGYKKNSNVFGYVEDGKVSTDLSCRMSCHCAFDWIEKHCTEVEKSDIKKRMLFREMEDRYPNPADRFVASVNITKWQRRQLFHMRYSGFGYYGSEMLFHIIPDDYYQDAANISVLKIECGSASYILPFIEHFCPHIYDRYYGETHISTELWEDIVAGLEEVRDVILHDTFNKELAPYIESFNFYMFKDFDPEIYLPKDDDARLEAKTSFLYKHRYEVAYLFEVFINWSKTQLDYYNYSGHDRMFSIQGP